MTEVSGFKSLGGVGYAEIAEKKSRFIGAASPVKDEEGAKAFLAEVRKNHKGANHNVFAYILGNKGEHPRASDDGEPQGTAGAPVLNVLKGQGLTNAVIVVTRYFGGTNLGANGLIRAYSKAAAEAVQAAGVVTLTLTSSFGLRINYSFLSKFQHEFSKNNVVIADTVYEADVVLKVLIEASRESEFLAACADLSNGTAEAVFVERKYL